MLYAYLVAPFADFEFMRRALVGILSLALSAPPIGVFLMLRRMSLIGDAMAHAILPGAAIGFLLAGLSLFALAGGGLVAGFPLFLQFVRRVGDVFAYHVGHVLGRRCRRRVSRAACRGADRSRHG